MAMREITALANQYLAEHRAELIAEAKEIMTFAQRKHLKIKPSRLDSIRNQESGGTLSVGFTQETVAHVRVRALASARQYRTARLSVWRSDANCSD
jgi:hypothetical protein